MTRHGETEADDFFRQDALAQGYLKQDPHKPGNGRGLRAYYRDNGMVQPEVLEKEMVAGRGSGGARNMAHEITGLDIDDIGLGVANYDHCSGCKAKRKVGGSTAL